MISLDFSAFLDQYWCKFEFGEAYRLVMDEGRRNYIVVVLLEKPTRNKLTPELNAYLKSHTYIDATNYEHDLETVRKRIRFAMPKLPLKQIKVRIDFIIVRQDIINVIAIT